MVSAEHDAHVNEARRVLRQRALEPEQRDDVAHSIVACDQGSKSGGSSATLLHVDLTCMTSIAIMVHRSGAQRVSG